MSKISSEFKARLDTLQPQDHIRAIVMLNIASSTVSGGRRQSHKERKETVEVIRQAGQLVLPAIDNILRNFQGMRISQTPDAMGCLIVDTTIEGIIALSNSPHVRAIFEDQPILALS